MVILSLQRNLFLPLYTHTCRASQVAQVVKNPPVNAGNVRDAGSTPGLGRSPGGGNGNPLQYSFLGSPVGRGAWWVAVHGVTKSWTQPRDQAHICVHACTVSFSFQLAIIAPRINLIGYDTAAMQSCTVSFNVV